MFLLNTENRVKEIASTIEDRMGALDELLIKKIAQGNLETSRQITLYSIIKDGQAVFRIHTGNIS
ncbi:MAG: BrxA family protein [Clostridia bacterium]